MSRLSPVGGWRGRQREERGEKTCLALVPQVKVREGRSVDHEAKCFVDCREMRRGACLCLGWRDVLSE